MPLYSPLANIMPAASMVSGAAVSAALCDQMRDNLVALWEGWWFRATRTTTQAIGASATTAVAFDTIQQSQTSIDDLSIIIVGGNIQTTKAGLWLVGGHVDLSGGSATTLDVAVDSTDSPLTVLADQLSDTATTKQAAACAITTKVATTPNTFTLYVFSSGGCTLNTNAMTAMFGVWVGDSP